MNDLLSTSLQKENPSISTDKISDTGISEVSARYGKKTKRAQSRPLQRRSKKKQGFERREILEEYLS